MLAKKKLIIIGGGGFSREVIWLAKECNKEWQIEGILDDNASLRGQKFCEIPVIGAVEDHLKFHDAYFIVAVGTPRTRKAIIARIESKNKVKFATLIHPSVQMSDYVEVGEGCIIAAGCILTTQISLGKHTIVNLACTVGHDVSIGDYCTLAPQVAISGNVVLGDGVEIGTGGVLIQGLSVGSGAFIGAGSVASKDIPDNTFAVGLPARHLKTLEAF